MKKRSLFKKTVASVAALTLAFSMVVVAPASAMAATAKKPAAVKSVKLKGEGNTITVKWKKQAASKADGYQVRYATNKAMKGAKTKTVKKAATNKVVLKKLKTATTYYVQVRAYKKAGKTLRGNWSKAKKITVWYVNTGDKELDKAIENILAKKVKVTGKKGLKRAFDYVADLPYINRETEPQGKWAVSGARKALDLDVTQKSDRIEGGNCYEVAALFSWLAKGLGYKAKPVSGSLQTKTKLQAHGWVEVNLDGQKLVCDPNLEHSYRGNNGAIRDRLESEGANTNLFLEAYDNAHYKYHKSK